ncbi:MAG TPA: hypothetical protein VGP76_11640 [Planctomycetaceae bacterium]|jgi:hypothetical protein|nr:hypothetical protein [Planctomycetaceae bacterium]
MNEIPLAAMQLDAQLRRCHLPFEKPNPLMTSTVQQVIEVSEPVGR